MRLRSGFEAKKLLETREGEWIRADLPMGPEICWVVGVLEPAGRDVVSFPIEGGGKPTLQSYRGDLFCLSLGSDCILDPQGLTAEFAEHRVFNGAPGVLTVTPAGTFLTVADGRNAWQDTADLNVETREHREGIAGGRALLSRWKLWATEAERTDGFSTPLLDYTATPLQQG